MSEESEKRGKFGEPWTKRQNRFTGHFTIHNDKCSAVNGDENIQRIVDCVNALEGVEDPAAYLEELRRVQAEDLYKLMVSDCYEDSEKLAEKLAQNLANLRRALAKRGE